MECYKQMKLNFMMYFEEVSQISSRGSIVGFQIIEIQFKAFNAAAQMKRKEKNVRAWTRCINRSPLCSILEYCGVNKYHVRPQHKPRLKLYKIKIIRKGFMKWGWINTLMVRMNRENISMVMTETGHSMHSFTIASWFSCQTWEQQYNVNDRCRWFW